MNCMNSDKITKYNKMTVCNFVRPKYKKDPDIDGTDPFKPMED